MSASFKPRIVLRQTPGSLAGHMRLFEGFSGDKRRLRDRQDIQPLLAEIRSQGLSG
jgi:hypothetical protein